MTEQTDRELLEMAAKAAGIQYDADASKPHPNSGAFWGLWLEFDREPSEYDRRYWNPLTDCGDALRLAVKLGITDLALAVGRYVMLEKHREGDNIEAITRRAITRAAAEIGKEMP